MAQPKITVLYYSTYGTNHAVAEAAAEAARQAGAEVRLRRVAETAPEEVVRGQDAWAAAAERQSEISEARLEDMAWADGYFISVPTRFGAPASQFRAFIDTLGPLWAEGGLVDKTITATTSAQNPHGGQEGTIQQVYVSAMHWGAIVVAPGYADPVKFEDGGNPYGYSQEGGALTETGRRSVAFQARRLVEITAKLVA